MDEDQLYQTIKPSMLKTLPWQMKQEAETAKLSEKEYCEAIDAGAIEAAAAMRFAHSMPEQSQLLTGSPP